MTMAGVEIITVKRPHAWIVKRDQPGVRTCKVCGKRADQVATMVCFEEEIERDVAPGDIE